MLPSISAAPKYSSWEADNNPDAFMNEVDELLLEQELLSPTSKGQTLASLNKRSPPKPDSTLEKLLNGEKTDLDFSDEMPPARGADNPTDDVDDLVEQELNRAHT